MTTSRLCHFCDAPLREVVVDLGSSPLANSYLTEERLQAAEKRYPLAIYRCTSCLLAQLPMFETPEEIFSHAPE